MRRRLPRAVGLIILTTAEALTGPEAQAGHRYHGRSNSANQQAIRQQSAAIQAEAKYELEMARQRQILLNGWAAEQMAARRRSQLGAVRRDAAIATIQGRHGTQSPPRAAAAPTPAPYIAPGTASK